MEVKTPEKKLLFVCTGNICRSPLAHGVFQKMADDGGLGQRFELESAGIQGYHVGENADPRMRSTAAQRGMPFSHLVRRFVSGDIEYYDYIFAMDRGHYDHILRLAGGRAPNLRMYREFDPQASAAYDVPDPYYGGQSGFDDVFDIVHRTSAEILKRFRDGVL